MSTRVAAHLNLSALQHNLAVIKRLAPRSQIMAMVKSNAYGHGFQHLIPALKNVAGFGVTDIAEGIKLREIGVNQKIVLMSGVFNQDELAIAATNHFDLVIHTAWQLELLKNFTSNNLLTVWLKIDSGMHRLGFSLTETEVAYRHLLEYSSITKPIHFITHLADAHLLERSTTTEQIARFHQLTKHFPGEKSIANSAGILAWPQSHSDWVRPGIMLYGVSPFQDGWLFQEE